LEVLQTKQSVLNLSIPEQQKVPPPLFLPKENKRKKEKLLT